MGFLPMVLGSKMGPEGAAAGGLVDLQNDLNDVGCRGLDRGSCVSHTCTRRSMCRATRTSSFGLPGAFLGAACGANRSAP